MEGRSYSHVSNYYQLVPECLWVGQIRKGAQNVFHAPHSQQKHLQDLSCWIGMREEESLFLVKIINLNGVASIQ